MSRESALAGSIQSLMVMLEPDGPSLLAQPASATTTSNKMAVVANSFALAARGLRIGANEFAPATEAEDRPSWCPAQTL